MNKTVIFIGEAEIIAFEPDGLAERTGRQTDRGVWLIAPRGEKADAWVKNTPVEELAAEAKALIFALPGIEDDAFYTEDAWKALHDRFPRLSALPTENRLIGYGDSASLALRFVFQRHDRFTTAVAVCPTAVDGGESFKGIAAAFMAAKAPDADVPHIAIADTAEGQGTSIGAAINTAGVNAHVHGERPVGGWELAAKELGASLAHL